MILVLMGEYIRKTAKRAYNELSLRIDYNEFKNGNEQTRKTPYLPSNFYNFRHDSKKEKNQKPRSRKRIYQ
ncbi:hypothetical protein BSPWISOXPB_4079 [uncultured Gammaproteobacteria bacterium]|nr:hypothetical protein BSPWISOXPB_4079 [uncultured Gammaproteobacteria bacterium]